MCGSGRDGLARGDASSPGNYGIARAARRIRSLRSSSSRHHRRKALMALTRSGASNRKLRVGGRPTRQPPRESGNVTTQVVGPTRLTSLMQGPSLTEFALEADRAANCSLIARAWETVPVRQRLSQSTAARHPKSRPGDSSVDSSSLLSPCTTPLPAASLAAAREIRCGGTRPGRRSVRIPRTCRRRLGPWWPASSVRSRP